MAQEYTLNFTSRRIYMIRGFLAVAIGLSITISIAIILRLYSQTLIFFGINTFFTVLLFYVSKNWYKGQLLIRLNNREITLFSSLSLFKHSKEYNFYWEDIKYISFVDTQFFRLLRIRDKKKKVVFAFEYTEDVARFEQMVNKRVFKLNQKGLIRIYQKPSIYETKVGYVMAVVLGLLMITWPLAEWIYNKSFQIGLALIFYSGAGFFIYKVFFNKRKR